MKIKIYQQSPAVIGLIELVNGSPQGFGKLFSFQTSHSQFGWNFDLNRIDISSVTRPMVSSDVSTSVVFPAI